MKNKPNSSSQQKGYNEQNPDEPHGAFDPAGKKMKKDSTKNRDRKGPSMRSDVRC